MMSIVIVIMFRVALLITLVAILIAVLPINARTHRLPLFLFLVFRFPYKLR